MYELLRRSPEVEFDPQIAHGALIYDAASAAVLERLMRTYMEIGIEHGRPVVNGTATWRAGRDRVAASAFAGRTVNKDNARFVADIRKRYADATVPIAVKGTIGPRGDAYRPMEAPDAETARDYHAWQIEGLAEGGADYLLAATIPALPEAIGLALAMRDSGLPYIVSFVINKDGGLLDGTPIDDAIAAIDDRVGDGTPRYGVNCVHPSVLQQALERTPGIERRIVSLFGNTTARSPEEHDGLEELDSEAPDVFAEANRRLLQHCDIRIVGGCCGTDPSHLRAIAGLA